MRIVVYLSIIAVLFLANCKKTDDVGGEMIPNGVYNDVVYTDTISINAWTVRDDSVNSGISQRIILGSYLDSVFGRLTTSFYTDVRLPKQNVSFGNPGDILQFDSLILNLVIDGYYGKDKPKLDLNIYEVNEIISADIFSNEELAFNPISLLQQKVTFNDTISDSTSNVYYFSFRLSDEFGKKLLNASESDLKNNETFISFFNGLLIAPSSSNDRDGLYYFDLNSPKTGLFLHYSKITTAADSKIDTLPDKFSFTINGECNRHTHFDHNNYAEANQHLLNQISGQSNYGDSILYIQSLGGLRVNIDFPYLKDFNKKGKILVNNAELILNIDETNHTFISYSPADYLSLSIVDDNQIYRTIPDKNYGEAYFGGEYNSHNGNFEYRLRINSYVQQLLDGTETSSRLSLHMRDGINYANRTILRGVGRNNKGIKLAITYTILK